MYQKVYHIKSVPEFASYFRQPLYHPMIGVYDMSGVGSIVPRCHLYFFNLLALRKRSGEPFLYGDETYHYRNGSMVAIAPLQLAGPTKIYTTGYTPSSRVLIWDNELFYGTRMGQMYFDYQFFSYRSNNSLDLTDEEREQVELYMDRLENMLKRQGERANMVVMSHIVANILDMCMNTFKRQMSLFCVEPSGILSATERYILDYFHNGLAAKHGLPRVADIANACGMHENYYGARFYKLTGLHVKDFIHFWMMNSAKTRLASSWVSIESVAKSQGFMYQNHFATFFKKLAGISPTEYQLKRFRELRLCRTELEGEET